MASGRKTAAYCLGLRKTHFGSFIAVLLGLQLLFNM